MSFSVKVSEKIRKFIKSIQKSRIREQNKVQHSEASTRIVESSNPSWIPPSGTVDGSGQISESNSMKIIQRKEKNQRKRKNQKIKLKTTLAYKNEIN